MFNAGIGKGPGVFDQDVEDFAINAVSQQMAMVYPRYSKFQPQIEEALRAGIQWQYSTNAAGAAQGGASVGDDNPWYDTVLKVALPVAGSVLGTILMPGVGTAIGGAIGGAAGGALAGAVTTADNPGYQSPGQIAAGALHEGINGAILGSFTGPASVGVRTAAAAVEAGTAGRILTWVGKTGLFWKATTKGAGAALTAAEEAAVREAIVSGAGATVSAESAAAQAAVAESLGLPELAAAARAKSAATAAEMAARPAAAAAVEGEVAPLAAAAETATAEAARTPIAIGPPKALPAASATEAELAQGVRTLAYDPAKVPTSVQGLLGANLDEQVAKVLANKKFIWLADRLGTNTEGLVDLVLRAGFNPGGEADAMLTRLLSERLGMSQSGSNYVLRWILNG
jgi:hypothetical protein